MTNQRLVFSPNIVDRLTGQRIWSCSIGEIDDVGTAGRGLFLRRTEELGDRVASEMREGVERIGIPWHIYHLGPRAEYTFRAQPVQTAEEARACGDDFLSRVIRIWLANRGVWEAIVGAGSVVSVPATAEDVDAYLSAWDELLTELMR